MRHDISVEGHAFRLRPIADADAAFVVALRSNPELNRFIHASSARVEDQLAWLAHYYERPGDYYFVLENHKDNSPEGVVSVYDIDPAAHSGEWGRWILKPGSLAAVECAWLIYRAAFESLGLETVYCRTIAENQAVVSFHDSCGITERRLLPAYAEIGGRHLDAVEHRIDRACWLAMAPKLDKLAQMTARRMQRG